MHKKSLTLSQEVIPILQDDFTPSKGNALQACVASIFGQSLDDVPNFIELECGYVQGIQNFVGGSYKVKKTSLNSKDRNDKEDDIGKVCILRGKSPRGNFGHVIVAKIEDNGNYKFLHDPHPDNTFLDPEEDYGWYIVFEQHR